MLDINGNKITEKEFEKAMKKNSLYKTIVRKGKKFGFEFTHAFIKDGHLSIWQKHHTDSVMKVYVDGFNADNKTAKIRVYSNGSLRENDLNSYGEFIKLHKGCYKFFEWLSTTDMTSLTTVFEKSDMTMEDGEFDNRIENGVGEAIREQLCKKYNVDSIVLYCGIKQGDDIYVVTDDAEHHKKYFSAWYDMHHFKNNKLVRTVPSIVRGSAYSDYFVDKMLMPTNKGDICNLIIRDVCLVGHKHHITKEATFRVTDKYQVIKGEFEVTDERKGW